MVRRYLSQQPEVEIDQDVKDSELKKQLSRKKLKHSFSFGLDPCYSQAVPLSQQISKNVMFG